MSTSSSRVTRGGFGTQPVFAGPSISARRPTSACIASRKRVQSARKSSETNSPGGSGSRAGGVSGCSLGPEIIPHPCVETVDNSGICEPQALGTQAATPGATLSRPGAVRHPSNGGNAQLNGGRATEIRAKSANLLATGRRSGLPWTVTGTRRRYAAKTPLFPHSLPAPLSKGWLSARQLRA